MPTGRGHFPEMIPNSHILPKKVFWLKPILEFGRKKGELTGTVHRNGQTMSIPPHILEFSISSQDTFPNQNSPWRTVGQPLPFVLINYSRCCEEPARLPLAYFGGPPAPVQGLLHLLMASCISWLRASSYHGHTHPHTKQADVPGSSQSDCQSRRGNSGE